MKDTAKITLVQLPSQTDDQAVLAEKPHLFLKVTLLTVVW